jgi:S-(hydroxymethyl)glutathione dehydrogenase/alcohol dehydrogenase
MKTVAANLIELGKPLTLAAFRIPALKPGQVLVEIAFSGVCAAYLLKVRGYRGNEPWVPDCFGH